MVAWVGRLEGSKRLALALVLAIGVTTWLVISRASAEAPGCRLLSDPARVAPLTSGVVKDLSSRESNLNPEELTTPTRRDAERTAELRTDRRRVLWACGSRAEGRVVVIYRSREPACRSIAGPGCPQPVPQVWVTCWQGLDLASGRKASPEGCIGFPSAER